MRALIQRVSEARVKIPLENYSKSINKGMVILLGISEDDTENEINYVAEKCVNLRIFDDENGKINLSLKEIDGDILLISQFTLYGDTRKGNRPSFNKAAKPELAEKLYNLFAAKLKDLLGDDKIKEGIFGAMMNVKIFNDGPVTVLVESK
ncbi:MAG: D-tyrosyl-tRNA(Tyr) deacylase [Ignavibacteriae bacterium]|nr:D-tyrosyl-tRNA(Tyr) deacylase [Ignavibacteriota bacterium]MCB0750788.1 D-tyrosyl-tRNA(Tyr) deacylase [Ignavibacteriota bacterium]MCB9206631.1 D-tyrosyl-tRNA(Tyr) deacylase [Ignavibacteriales bacterium]MCB9209719.1 D-tyrosyl-tRNA(Tyr) deacylase [Ignavibacteriales bacterium]MCB9218875.1 D-tyrosyl-tRNA(Tyr) deacylase [Ignavibacteriales bacterium]